MENNKVQNKLLTIGEIAKTCGVTKHTLLHYDEIGLLKPEFVNEKGYRYYSLKQCYSLDMINILKKAGSSLQEISDFFANQNKTMFTKLIQQKKNELQLEMLKLKRVDHFLEYALEYFGDNKEYEKNTPIIMECEAEYFVAAQVSKQDDHEYAKSLSRLRTFCEDNLIAHEFPLWSITKKENFEVGDYYPNYVANKLTYPNQIGMVIKPKGRYVIMTHKGFYDTMATDTYPQIKKYIEANHLTICGDVYEEEILNYLTERNSDDFVIRISVAVQ
ncbi:MerR family transcriptional regulator [Paenibacillus sp. LS1]|uniref:MerR family transcriptional regulator n=1 Tax=Paenibacillus sp. LS1 TaxID=2992120 RepID=UPI0022301084|nr:MerR family transcriptional regulator [Paenibacillus sp. LS1]MCW3792653.1 MerR family transcriptional regulator [Paenibacillus sp. LS1]